MAYGKDLQMNIRIIGAVLVVIGCGCVGFRIASVYKREEWTLRQLINALDYMECELQYRLTPLPALCRQTAMQSSGMIRVVFLNLAHELEDQIHPDVWRCMSSALTKSKELPSLTKLAFEMLGKSLGRFDIDGQLKGLESVRTECRRNLSELTCNRDTRIRSYQTLGLCAGAAIAILFI